MQNILCASNLDPDYAFDRDCFRYRYGDRQTRSPTSHEITLKVSNPFSLPYFYKHTNAVASPRPGIRLCLDGQRMTQLPPFRSSDESGEAMFNIRCLAAARRLLESLREQPEARPHLLVPVGSDLPQRCDGYSWASPTMRGPGRWRDGSRGGSLDSQLAFASTENDSALTLSIYRANDFGSIKSCFYLVAYDGSSSVCREHSPPGTDDCQADFLDLIQGGRGHSCHVVCQEVLWRRLHPVFERDLLEFFRHPKSEPSPDPRSRC